MVFLTTHTRILVKLHANPVPTVVRQRLCNLLRRSNTMGIIVACLVGSEMCIRDRFFSVGPGYYTMLVELNHTAYVGSDAGSNLRDQLPIYYDIFYWGYPALTTIGLIYSLAWTILWARKIYFASEEVRL